MEDLLVKYKTYLEVNKKFSRNTVEAYLLDINKFFNEMETGLEGVNKIKVIDYIILLQEEKKSNSTISRAIASLRSFFNFCQKEGLLKENPTLDLTTPKVSRKQLEFLSQEEVDNLLNLPKSKDLKGLRDKALLEVLYSTGIRVSELIGLKREDLEGEWIVLEDRKIFIGENIRDKIEEYLLLRDKKHIREELFTNNRGNKLTRQGVWKIVKHYGDMLCLNKPITPQVLRTSLGIHLLNNGASYNMLKSILGYKDVANLENYYYVWADLNEEYKSVHPRI